MHAGSLMDPSSVSYGMRGPGEPVIHTFYLFSRCKPHISFICLTALAGN